jgi:LPXTG-site transpeptidase (sortase) family protein
MQVPRTSVLSRPRRFVQNRSLVVRTGNWRIPKVRTQPELPASCSRPRRIFSYILLSVGGILCTYVAGNYAWMYIEQKELLHQWKIQNASSPNDGTLTKLSVPRISLRAVVLESTSRRSLLLGPAHLAGTASPGSAGNAVIAGHRDTFFRRIHDLRNGDDVYIQKNGKQFHYVVVGRNIVASTDLSVLRASSVDELTLITCYPTHFIGPAPRRLVVLAKFASGT